MNYKVNTNINYRCNICNKNYSSSSSLCNHNKKFHQEQKIICDQKEIISDQKEINCDQKEINKLNCMYCNKIFSFKTNKYRHEKTCKQKDAKHSDIKQIELKLQQQEQEIIKLKKIIQKSKNTDISTVNQINKLLLERDKQYQQYINNINNGNINNYNGNVVNNIQLIGFGKEENIIEKLTNKEKKLILNSRYKSLEKLVEIVHCGNYNEFKNILVTNANNNYMYKFDSYKKQFILSPKDDVINSLIDNRIYDLETIYDSFLEENKLDEKTKDIIEIFINKINNYDNKYTDDDGNTYKTYKHYKVEQVKLILYNNKDKMIDDITLLLTTSNVDNDFVV
jgi:hypothetical protein